MKLESKKVLPNRYSDIKNTAYHAYCKYYIDGGIDAPDKLERRNFVNKIIVDFCNGELENDIEKQIFLDTYTFPFDQILYDNILGSNKSLEKLANSYSVDVELLRRKIQEYINYRQFYDKTNKIPAFRDLDREYIKKIEKSAPQFNQADNIVLFHMGVDSIKNKNSK